MARKLWDLSASYQPLNTGTGICLSFCNALVIFLTLPPAFKSFSLWRCRDRCVIRYFMFSLLSQPFSVLRRWSFGKRIRRSVAKNEDNWMITVRQSLVQSHFAVQSYPKEESGLICLISTGGFSLRSLGTNFATHIDQEWCKHFQWTEIYLDCSSTFTDNSGICHAWLLLCSAS